MAAPMAEDVVRHRRKRWEEINRLRGLLRSFRDILGKKTIKLIGQNYNDGIRPWSFKPECHKAEFESFSTLACRVKALKKDLVGEEGNAPSYRKIRNAENIKRDVTNDIRYHIRTFVIGARKGVTVDLRGKPTGRYSDLMYHITVSAGWKKNVFDIFYLNRGKIYPRNTEHLILSAEKIRINQPDVTAYTVKYCTPKRDGSVSGYALVKTFKGRPVCYVAETLPACMTGLRRVTVENYMEEVDGGETEQF